MLASSARVYAADVPGDPGRSEPIRLPLRGPAIDEWLTDLLAGLKVERASLVGISLGAWMALRYAIAHPERVARLVLLTPAGLVNPRASYLPRLLLVPLLGRAYRQFFTRWLLDGVRMPESVERFFELITAHFRPRIDTPPRFTDAELRRLSVPALLVAGARDRAFAWEAGADRFKRLVPGAEVRLLASSGHMLVGHAPLIAAFLSAHHA
jgi:pimeloyl-ACP methyl ester carboxylesterase